MKRPADVATRALTAIEGQQWLDIPSYKLEHGMTLVLNLLGEATEPVRNLLHGVWLGHPLHPTLTDIPTGAWTAAMVMDFADTLRPRAGEFRAGAQRSIGVGLVGAVASAVTGLADWQYTHDNARRVGLVHGLLNLVGTGLYAGSWWQRRRGQLGQARMVSGVGYLAVVAGGYLGGSLVTRHRIGVDHADRQLEPRGFAPALAADELAEGQLCRADVDGVAVVLVRSEGRVHALGEQCSHLGGPLSEGWLYRDGIVCPWHGSRFDLASGRSVSGPAAIDVPCFETRERGGQIEVRRRPPVPTATPGAVVAREQEHADAGH